jgi:uncharacterized protein DUF1932
VRHAARRVAEVDAARELLDSLGVPARVATAARDWLAELAADAGGAADTAAGEIGAEASGSADGLERT